VAKTENDALVHFSFRRIPSDPPQYGRTSGGGRFNCLKPVPGIRRGFDVLLIAMGARVSAKIREAIFRPDESLPVRIKAAFLRWKQRSRTPHRIAAVWKTTSV
jgi:hypothetical protein